jgi:hypothetical protein
VVFALSRIEENSNWSLMDWREDGELSAVANGRFPALTQPKQIPSALTLIYRVDLQILHGGLVALARLIRGEIPLAKNMPPLKPLKRLISERACRVFCNRVLHFAGKLAGRKN